MRRLLFGLLKLLLKLLIFAATGSWPQFRERAAEEGQGKRAPATNHASGRSARQQPRVRSPRGAAARPTSSLQPYLRAAKTKRARRVPALEEIEAGWSPLREGDSALRGGEAADGGFRRGLPTRALELGQAGRRAGVAGLPTPAQPVRRALASAIRDPRVVRDAVILLTVFERRRDRFSR